jgi:hypothetical protein
MSVTQDDIDALEAAINTGALKVKFGSGPDSREVTYRSLNDMKQTLSDMRGALSPATQPSLRTVGGYSSGLGRPDYCWPGHWDRR